MRKPWLPLTSALVAAVAGVTLAFTVPARASVAGQSPPKPMVEIQPKGTIVDAGRYVRVTVRIQCQGEATVTVTVSLDKPVPPIHGSGSTSGITCTGVEQDVPVLVRSQGTIPFVPGMALATADLVVCMDGNCVSGTDARQIYIG